MACVAGQAVIAAGAIKGVIACAAAQIIGKARAAQTFDSAETVAQGLGRVLRGRCQIDAHPCRRGGIRGPIHPVAAVQAIGPRPSQQRIIAKPSQQRVILGAAIKLVCPPIPPPPPPFGLPPPAPPSSVSLPSPPSSVSFSAPP